MHQHESLEGHHLIRLDRPLANTLQNPATFTGLPDFCNDALPIFWTRSMAVAIGCLCYPALPLPSSSG
jgi:hypothetical protein